MRQFRGLTKDGNWVYGEYISSGKALSYIVPEDAVFTLGHNGLLLSNIHSVIPETVGQSTGIPDKNKKEIYEGDIVKIKPMYLGFVNGLVGWNKSYASYQVKALDTNWLFDGIESFEIIGDIHTTPKLMENKND